MTELFDFAGGNSSNVLVLLSVMGFLSFLLLFVTSFVKIAIVFGLLRSALGTPQMPPTTVITGLSIILSFYIMYPVFSDTYDECQPHFKEFISKKTDSATKVELFLTMAKKGSDPLRKFLSRHAHEKDKNAFHELSKVLHKKKGRSLGKENFLVLIPSFLLSEITEAFQIGFLLFLPFLILDLLTANILMALGMHMLSPTTVSLPFKLLLFVAVDGFALLSYALVKSYTVF
jgi:type III secretion protein R